MRVRVRLRVRVRVREGERERERVGEVRGVRYAVPGTDTREHTELQ